MRFIIVSVPPTPLLKELRKIQELFSSLTGAVEALRYPPHVTLRTGMVCPDEDADKAVRAFLDHAGSCSAALISSTGAQASAYLDTIGEERGFLGYQIELSPELVELHQSLLLFDRWQKGPQGFFSPHISLCYHDITHELAQALMDGHYAELAASKPAWEASSAELWVQVEGCWRFHARAKLLPALC